MSILLTTLRSQLAREMGDTDTSNVYYDDTQRLNALVDGVDDYNENATTQQYEKSGSGESVEISPTPSTEDQRLIVLHGALALTHGEIAKSARTAIIHSNPAGRTDLSRVTEALEAFAERLEEKIEKIRVRRRNFAVEKEVKSTDFGVELKGKPSGEAEAIGILDIQTTED